MQPFIRQLQTSLLIARDEGLGSLSSRAINFARRKLGIAGREQAAYEQRKASVDATFDQFGMETGGVQRLCDLNIIGKNAVHGTNHVASDPDDFAAAIEALSFPVESSTFVDLGSGKGRAVLLAATYPFHKIVGVEFAQELHEAALRNVQHLRHRGLGSAQIELIHGDATAFEFPHTPVVLYLFNPFGGQIVQKVAEHAMTSWQSAPRPFTIIYANPVHADRFCDAGWRQCRRERAFSLFLPE